MRFKVKYANDLNTLMKLERDENVLCFIENNHYCYVVEDTSHYDAIVEVTEDTTFIRIFEYDTLQTFLTCYQVSIRELATDETDSFWVKHRDQMIQIWKDGHMVKGVERHGHLVDGIEEFFTSPFKTDFLMETIRLSDKTENDAHQEIMTYIRRCHI